MDLGVLSEVAWGSVALGYRSGLVALEVWGSGRGVLSRRDGWMQLARDRLEMEVPPDPKNHVLKHRTSCKGQIR